MPLKKLSRAEIREHLRRWIWMYALGIALLVFLNHLVFSMTQPRIPEENILRIYLVGAPVDADAVSGMEETLLARVQAAEDSIEKIELVNLPFSGDGATSTDMLLPAKLVAGDADAFICSAAAYRTLLNLGACLPLDAYIEGGWMQGSAGVYAENEAGGRFVSAIERENLAFLQADAADAAYSHIIVAANSKDTESTINALGALLSGL